MADAILYSGTKNASSWAMRAWLALRAAEVEFREVVVDIRRPQRFPNLQRIGALSPAAMVPVLVVDGEVIFDSSAIMEFANDACGGRLLPRDSVRRAQARALVAWQHSGLSAICGRISFESSFYPFKRPLSDREIAECARLFDHVEHTLARSGGPSLFGDVSLADFALVPAVVRLTRHNLQLDRWPLANAWTRHLLANELVSDWMGVADTLPHIWFDEYVEDDGPLPGVRADSPSEFAGG